MTIDVPRAMDYVRANFDISGEAQRMADNLLEHVNGRETPNATDLVLDVLGGFGFERADLDALVTSGIIVEDA